MRKKVIRIDLYLNQQGEIQSFQVEGHAGYAPKGQDIVCAAVSALTFGTVNAITELLAVPLDVDMEEGGGFLRCTVPSGLAEDVREKVQLLLQGMQLSLRSIEQEYGRNLKIVIHEKVRG